MESPKQCGGFVWESFDRESELLSPHESAIWSGGRIFKYATTVRHTPPSACGGVSVNLNTDLGSLRSHTWMEFAVASLLYALNAY